MIAGRDRYVGRVTRPPAIQLYALLTVAKLVVVGVRGGGDAVLVVPAAALIALLTYGVWVANTAAWRIALAVQAAVLLPIGNYGPSWTIALNAIALVLLVLPSSRAFVFGAPFTTTTRT